jgi:hypothetical protein
VSAEISPLENAVGVIVDRTKALAAAMVKPFMDGSPRDGAHAILLLAFAQVVKDEIAEHKFEPRRALYAKRLCIEAKQDPEQLVLRDPPGFVRVLDADLQSVHLPRLSAALPLWVLLYEKLPSLGGIENNAELHDMGPFGWDACFKCGCSPKEIADGCIDKFICPGPCTEAEIWWETKHIQAWRHPNGTKYIVRLPMDAEAESGLAQFRAQP